jgi:hypothetical protein
MTTTEMKNLPLNGRDYQKAIFLTPGVAGPPDQITDSPGSFGIFSLNGVRGRSNNFLLDGTDMTDGAAAKHAQWHSQTRAHCHYLSCSPQPQFQAYCGIGSTAKIP